MAEIKLMPIQLGYFQHSTDSGYVRLEVPMWLGAEDAEETIALLELVIRGIRRRSLSSTDTLNPPAAAKE